MESLYAKLYDKYDKLKKRKLSEMDDIHRDQEEKFLNYVRAAEELIQHLRSENDKLNAEVTELRSEVASIMSSKDKQCVDYQKLLIEESQKRNWHKLMLRVLAMLGKALSEEVTRPQNLHRKGHVKGGNRGNVPTVSPGSVHVAAERVSGNSTRMMTRKRSRKSTAKTEDSIVTPNSANGKVTASCALTEYLPEKALSCEVLPNVQLPECCKGVNANATDHGTCLFQVLIECLVGMKVSSINQTDGLRISALHQSSVPGISPVKSPNVDKQNGHRGSRAGVPGIVVRDIRESGTGVDEGCHYVQHKYVPRFL
ncbi:Detected protein of confused Function [Hibiscus syriacus]|uniref:Detected protein of confused Function n=1 Tax=Hibiscus syriacus TaxID=106335 RepID=A0A6A3D8K7_HIBSY|nr:Detected protein of confused Function [Hibiscus syriacus]